MNGYYGIGLEQPKNSVHIGNVIKTAEMYEAAFIAATGNRFDPGNVDLMRRNHRIPVQRPSSLLEALPYDCVPVAVEYTTTAIMLPEYVHPEIAFYIFSADDQSLTRPILEKCADVIRLPIMQGMGLASRVNVVLYDRVCKAWNNRKMT